MVLPIQVKQFKFGQSNPTYFLTDSKGIKYVMRKKPPGKLLSQTAHAIEREYRIIKAVGEHTDVPVPKVYCLCTDEAVLGTPFYVMQFIQGRIFADIRMSDTMGDEERRQCWQSAITTLAKLHRVDPIKAGLSDYGSHEDFYHRQIRSLGRVSQAQAIVSADGQSVGQIPGIDWLLKWYDQKVPTGELCIVHGDYKIDNLIFHPTEPRLIGVLDWELSTLVCFPYIVKYRNNLQVTKFHNTGPSTIRLSQSFTTLRCPSIWATRHYSSRSAGLAGKRRENATSRRISAGVLQRGRTVLSDSTMESLRLILHVSGRFMYVLL